MSFDPPKDAAAQRMREMSVAASRLYNEFRAVETELRQALWDVYGILGFDQDGDETPEAVRNLIPIVIDAAKEFRREYDAVCSLGDKA